MFMPRTSETDEEYAARTVPELKNQGYEQAVAEKVAAFLYENRGNERMKKFFTVEQAPAPAVKKTTRKKTTAKGQ